MLRYENHCVGCASSLGCSPACRLKHIAVYYCDDCGAEIDGYRFISRDGEKDLCLDCLMEEHKPVCDNCGKEIDGEVFRDGSDILCVDCLCEFYKNR